MHNSLSETACCALLRILECCLETSDLASVLKGSNTKPINVSGTIPIDLNELEIRISQCSCQYFI